MAKLILKFNGAVVKELLLALPETTIGRRSECDLVIDNPAVSGQHAKVVRDADGTYFLEDLGSTNGTFMQDRRVTKATLRHDDTIQIAKHTVTFINEQEAQAAPPPAKEVVSSDATVVMTAPPAAVAPKPAVARDAFLRTLEGEGPAEPLPLSHLTTYVGKSAQALVKLKGFFQPELACCIVKKADGHSLTALKDRFVKLNGDALMDQAQVPLKEGDVIHVGGLKLLYFLQEKASPTH